MPISVVELAAHLSDEAAETEQSITSMRDEDRQAPERLRRLATYRTDAFVDLARLYLPDLSHQSVADSWSEVRGRVKDLLLLKERECRLLREKVDQAQAARQQEELSLESKRSRAERARLDLRSKTASANESLRGNAAIERCHAAIAEIDAEIESTMEQLEIVAEQAKSKLPDYEECELFQYLRSRHYGTPRYDASGFERRWDRWVAKLINYSKARESYEFLTKTPDLLRQLIEKKTHRYKELLREVETARRQGMEAYDIPEATAHWKKLLEEATACEANVKRLRVAEARAQQKLSECENINGPHYHRAIDVFREFLSSLDPEILRVYAACTNSAEDDQICAQLREIQGAIRDQAKLSARRADRIVNLQKYLAGLQEIHLRLSEWLPDVSARPSFRDELQFTDRLCELKYRALNPAQLWRRIRSSIVTSSGQSEPVCESAQDVPLHEAVFLAASKPRSVWKPKLRTDLSGVVVSPVRQVSAGDQRDQPMGYTTMALCGSTAEARFVTSLLESHDIQCFFHHHDGSQSYGNMRGNHPAADHIHVMVNGRQFNDARQLILDYRQQQDSAWECRACTAAVDSGYDLCWRCWKTRPKTDIRGRPPRREGKA